MPYTFIPPRVSRGCFFEGNLTRTAQPVIEEIGVFRGFGELLWESFSKEGIDYPSPEWHGRVLSERSAIVESGKATWLSVDELQARLSNR